MQSRRLAGRWAAKEAIVKALGTGWRNVGYRDAEVIAEPGHAPQVQLHGAALALGGTWRWALSISHDGEYAIACASALPVPQETPLPGGLSNEFEEYSHYLARLCGEYLLLHTQTQNPQLPEAERATAQLKLLPNLLGLQKTLTQVLVAQP
jgi:holo-[acyl-carrier protein] synthase